MSIKKFYLLFFFPVFILSCISFAATAQGYKMVNNEVVLNQNISFKTGTATLDPASESALKIIKKYLDDKPYISMLRIECHTDNSIAAKESQKLTEKRAFVVCMALIDMGIDCKRLIPVGFGALKPVANNNTPEGRASNNRITIVNAALKGKLIGGMPADGGGTVAGDLCTQ